MVGNHLLTTCEFCTLHERIVNTFPGRSISIRTSAGLPGDIFPAGSISGDWPACAHCATLARQEDHDLFVAAVADKIVSEYQHPLLGQGSVQPKVIALLARYRACTDPSQSGSYLMDDLVTPNQRVLMDLYRNTTPSACPGGHVFSRQTAEKIHISAFLRHSSSVGKFVVYFYDIFSENRARGHASAYLKRLIKSADTHGVIVELPVMANDVRGYSGALNDDELIAWYQRYAFEILDDERSPAGHPLMRRMPQ